MRHILILMIGFMAVVTPGWALDNWEDEEEGFTAKDAQLLKEMEQSLDHDIQASRTVERYRPEFDRKTDTVDVAGITGIAAEGGEGVSGIAGIINGAVEVPMPPAVPLEP